jgi:hypothetical protein
MSANRSIEGAVVRVLVSNVENGVQTYWSGSGFMVGPSSVVTALHVINHPGIVSISVETGDGKFIGGNGQNIPVDVNSLQYYVDLAQWNKAIATQGGEWLHEFSTDVAVLKTTQTIGFQTGWLPLYDLHSGPVTIYGYPAGVQTVLSGGVLQDISVNGDTFSSITGVPAISGGSGGLVADAAGNAVAVVVAGDSTTMGAVNLSPTMIANLQGSIALNNASIQPEIAGRESYYLAHQLAPEWAELNLSSLVTQQNWPVVRSTVENALVAAVQAVGPDVAVDFIAGAFGVSLSPSDHQVLSAEMGVHPVALIGILEQAMLPLMGAIPM